MRARVAVVLCGEPTRAVSHQVALCILKKRSCATDSGILRWSTCLACKWLCSFCSTCFSSPEPELREQADPAFSVQLVSRLAGRTITYDARSTYNNTSIALMTVYAHWIYTTIKDIKHGRLSFITASVFASDEDNPRLEASISPHLITARDRILRALGGSRRSDGDTYNPGQRGVRRRGGRRFQRFTTLHTRHRCLCTGSHTHQSCTGRTRAPTTFPPVRKRQFPTRRA